MSMMPVIYGKMMIEKDVRNFILRIGKIEISGISQKFLPYRRNFCHFLSNMFILAHIRLWGQYAQYEKNAEFYSEYSDLEISAIWQKFLDPNFFTIVHISAFLLVIRKNVEWKARLEFHSGYSDAEISAISQKFLPFLVKISDFGLNRALTRKRWM